MQTESRHGHEPRVEVGRLNEEERRDFRTKLLVAKAVLEEMESILAGDGFDSDDYIRIESHLFEIKDDLRKHKEYKGGKSFDEARSFVEDIAERVKSKLRVERM